MSLQIQAYALAYTDVFPALHRVRTDPPAAGAD